MLKAPGSRCSDGSWDTHVLPGLWSSSDGSRLEVTFEIWAVEASSVGRVRVVSSDPEKLPVLEQPFSALSDHDLTVLVEGIELVRRLAGSSVLAPFVAEELEPGPSRDLERWVREHSGGYWHPVGTCRMGPAGNPDAVVDAVGRVHGIDGVVVADASIFPTIPRANTNLPTMGAAEYIASTLAAADAKEESTEPPPDYKGILQSPTPLGPNRISAHEERIDSFSYQVGTQLDNLNHIGVGQVFYGGRRGREIAETWGTNSLGSEHAGPIVTRGILLDVLGLKLVQGASDDLEAAPNGAPHLAATYRITLEDLEAAMRQARIQTIERGDVVLIRTGWNQLLEPHDPTSPHAPDDPTHPGHPGHQAYLRSEPGIYLREARWLASRRPAIVGADNWALEVLGDPVVASNVFPVHQELITHFGIRIGEAIVTDRLAADRLFEFVYIVTPQLAFGATAGNTPPCALGQPR
ncbi:MAG: GMC oxidoreductase [Candidatus Rokuibacteriota bacterium]